MRLVAMMDTSLAGADAAGTPLAQQKLHFKIAVKTYFFHYARWGQGLFCHACCQFVHQCWNNGNCRETALQDRC
jgi:hypothetical protein